MLSAFTSSLSSFSFPGPMRDAAVGDCSLCETVPTITHPNVSTSCLNSCSDASCSSGVVFCSCTSTRMVAGLTSDSEGCVMLKAYLNQVQTGPALTIVGEARSMLKKKQ